MRLDRTPAIDWHVSVRRLATNRIAASSSGCSVSTLVTVDAMLAEHVYASITWRKNGCDETWIRKRVAGVGYLTSLPFL